jgi:hypothetical protein
MKTAEADFIHVKRAPHPDWIMRALFFFVINVEKFWRTNGSTLLTRCGTSAPDDERLIR